jgi:hypothetical protein
MPQRSPERGHARNDRDARRSPWPGRQRLVVPGIEAVPIRSIPANTAA